MSQLLTNKEKLQEALNILQTKAAPPSSGGGSQATPVITVNSSTGLITATAGSKSSTKQLAFQAAQTITPGTTDKTIAGGTYLGGTQTIKGDSNLVAGNIVAGKTIFGITGTASSGDGSSSGGTDIEDSLITRTCTTYTNDRVTTIGSYAFYNCARLTTVSFPAATSIGSSAFCNCSSLTAVSFPLVTTIDNRAFLSCTRLTTISFPVATSIDGYAFCNCSSLTTADFPKATTIGSSVFYACYNLKSLYLLGSSVCTLAYSNAFASTPIGGYSTSAGTYGSIYVPASLLTQYQSATNWTYFSSRFVGV